MQTEYLQEGTLLGMHYRIIKHVADGGFGRVYEAEDTKMSRNVILKEYYRQENMEEEWKNYQKLDGVFGIPVIQDRFMEEGNAWLVMDYVPCQTLEEYLNQRENEWTEEETKEILKRVLVILHHIHSCDLVHCDISPENILIDKDGYVRLIDFNAMKKIGTVNQGEDVFLKDGYSAYEQYYEQMEVTPATDIYAIGALLYRMLYGHVPAKATEASMETLEGREETTILLKMCLNQDAKKRFQSVAALYRAICSEDVTVAAYERLPETLLQMGEKKQEVESSAIKTFTSAPLPKETEEVVTVSPESSMNQEGMTEQKKGKKGKLIAGIVAVVLILAVAATGVIWSVLQEEEEGDETETTLSQNEIDYAKALELYEEGQYAESVEILEELGDYEDSYKTLYAIANSYEASSNSLQDAIDIYEYLGDYEESISKLCDIAERYMDDEKYEEAKDIYAFVQEYQNVKEESKECDYRIAMQEYYNRKYEDAKDKFEKLGDYVGKESAVSASDMVKECKYGIANTYLNSNEYEKFPECREVFLEGKYYDELENMAYKYQEGGYYDEAMQLYLDLQKWTGKDYGNNIRVCQASMLEMKKYEYYEEENSKDYDDTLGTYLNHVSAQDAERAFSSIYGTYKNEDGKEYTIAKTTLNDVSYGIKKITIGSSTEDTIEAVLYYQGDEENVFTFVYTPNYEYKYTRPEDEDTEEYIMNVNKIQIGNEVYYSSLPILN